MAVEAGDAEAAALLGAVYEMGPKTRDLYVPQDLDTAESLYDRASADESPDEVARFALYRRGTIAYARARDALIAEPKALWATDAGLLHAAQLYTAAADRGSAEAMNALGLLAEDGVAIKPSENKFTKAEEWFERALKAGFTEAARNLVFVLQQVPSPGPEQRKRIDELKVQTKSMEKPRPEHLAAPLLRVQRVTLLEL
jgi:TPR repeat protein